jgi:CBS-domain-containing membrane protein
MGHWKVGDVMTADVVSVREDASFREIVDLLREHDVSALPVVDGGNLVVGVVSEADLLHKLEFAGDSERPRLFEGHRIRVARERAAGVVARDLMSTPAVTVMPQVTIVEAAKLMESSRVKRLPVVNLAGRLIGIVSRQDLVKVFLRSDEEIRAAVLRELRGLWDDVASEISVEVEDGIVTIAGEFDRKSTLPIAVRFAQRVDGVVDVIDRLTYRYDDTRLDMINLP